MRLAFTRSALVTALCCAVCLVTACGQKGNENPALDDRDKEPEQSKEVLLHCGAGIRPAADALINAFEGDTGITVVANYSGGGRLLGSIAAMQKGDLFMPGAAFYIDKAIEQDVAARDSRRTVAYFVPVILVAKGNPKNIRSVHDLTQDGLRLGLGDERSCAVGKATLGIIEKNGMDLGRIRENTVYQSATVNELAVAVELGSVDAAIVWDAVARHFSESADIVPIDLKQNVTSEIPIALLNSSVCREEALAFINFVVSERGRQILTENGYCVSLSDGREGAK